MYQATLALIHFEKMIYILYKKHSEKLIVIFNIRDFALAIV